MHKQQPNAGDIDASLSRKSGHPKAVPVGTLHQKAQTAIQPICVESWSISVFSTHFESTAYSRAALNLPGFDTNITKAFIKCDAVPTIFYPPSRDAFGGGIN